MIDVRHYFGIHMQTFAPVLFAVENPVVWVQQQSHNIYEEQSLPLT